jgi:sugar lactone lactonase YvrE
MVAVGVLDGLPRGELGEFNPSRFQVAQEAVAGRLTEQNVPDFTDLPEVKARIEALAAQITELRDMLVAIKDDLRDIKQTLEDLANRPVPAATPTPPSTTEPTAPPSPVPTGTPSGVTPTEPVATPTPSPRPTASAASSVPEVTTLAGSWQGYADGNGAEAQFGFPRGLTLDASGQLFVTDQSNVKIRRVTSTGSVSTLAGSSEGYADGPGVQAQFMAPVGVAVDAAGVVYVADMWNHCIRVVSPTGVVTTLAGSTLAGDSNGPGFMAGFRSPTGLARTRAGTLYVSDNGTRIRKISPDGSVNDFVGSTLAGSADGTGSAARFSEPDALAVDGLGMLYVAEAGNHRIRKISPAGVVTTLAGSSQGFADGAGAAARFDTPRGLAVDARGNVYVADAGNHRIRKVSPEGVVTTVAGSIKGFADGPAASDARFDGPWGVAVDAAGNVYVADSYNYRIRKISP